MAIAHHIVVWCHRVVLHLLVGSVLAINRAGTVSRVLLVEGSHASLLDVFLGGAMQFFLEDGIGLVDLELGLEVTQNLSGRVGATAGVDNVVA